VTAAAQMTVPPSFPHTAARALRQYRMHFLLIRRENVTWPKPSALDIKGCVDPLPLVEVP
jgi:hypothetical protein